MAKMGRPKNDPELNLSDTLTARMSRSEREACEKAAARAEMKITAWMRDRLSKAAKRESKRD
jgi:predicted HicB family RNase H-like nuclease